MKKKKIEVTITDYHNFTSKNTPLDKRRSYNVGNIWNNSAKCLKCNEVIRSTNKHDYRACSCGAIAIDGGSWYVKMVGNQEDCKLLTELYDDAIDELGNER